MPAKQKGAESKHGQGKAVSATDLAQMAICERLVYFECRFGKRRTPVQREALARGLRAHRRFYRERAIEPEYWLRWLHKLVNIVVRWLRALVHGRRQADRGRRP